jgi:hypothetical protein
MTNMAEVHIRARDVFGKPVPNIRAELEDKNGHTLATVSADGFKPARCVLNFDGEAEVLMLMDAEQRNWPDEIDASRQLHGLVLRHTYVAGADVLGYTLGIVHTAPDRVYYVVREQLLEDLETSAAFERANATMHEPPPGFDWGDPLISYKGRNAKAAPQLTMWRGNVAGVPGLEAGKRVILEADVDLSKGLRHTLDALLIHPITGQPDPRIVAQLVTYYRGLPLPWRA